MFTKEVCENIAQIKGSVRGAVFQTDAEYIRRCFGQEKLDQLQKILQNFGYPIDYRNIRAMEWHPLSRRVLAFKVMKDLFDWHDEDFKKMGNTAPKYSFIVRLMMKFFISAKIAITHAPQYWSRHYDVGSLTVVEFNEEKKHAVIRINDFKITPIYCRYLEGYFKRLFSFTLPKEIIKITETQCMHHGGSCHEYSIYWSRKRE